MKNNHRFFSNVDCKYFPCHDVKNKEEFNCLFCYCPLYFLGDSCGGNFEYVGKNKVKNCLNCKLPHAPSNYDYIMEKLKEACKKDVK